MHCCSSFKDLVSFLNVKSPNCCILWTPNKRSQIHLLLIIHLHVYVGCIFGKLVVLCICKLTVRDSIGVDYCMSNVLDLKIEPQNSHNQMGNVRCSLSNIPYILYIFNKRIWFGRDRILLAPRDTCMYKHAHCFPTPSIWTKSAKAKSYRRQQAL